MAPMTVKAWRERFSEDGLKDFSSGAAGAGAQAVDPGGEGRGDRALDAARDAAGRDALELPVDGRAGWRVAGDGAADLVRAGACSRIGSRRSSCQTTRGSRRSSSMSSACI